MGLSLLFSVSLFASVDCGVESVDVSFEFLPTLSPNWWMTSCPCPCAEISFQITVARGERSSPHLPLAT